MANNPPDSNYVETDSATIFMDFLAVNSDVIEEIIDSVKNSRDSFATANTVGDIENVLKNIANEKFPNNRSVQDIFVRYMIGLCTVGLQIQNRRKRLARLQPAIPADLIIKDGKITFQVDESKLDIYYDESEIEG